ncbi:hypothetical protein [Thermococcus nautili]|uniref:PH domain-containing protein n=1 Tax=Thermococcus nautili TaxID=195522 RepID=W8NVS6_9EURY|nr:hypothetical protein [Thermococcus nautili]AHL23262.1 hypothetical protein BD01_1658 [Thermococcus nautili]
MLYEETLYSKWIIALLVPPIIGMSIGLYESFATGQGVLIMTVATALTIAVILEAMAFRVRVYEDRIFLSGFLGLFIRKTIRIDEIEWFAVRNSWVSCNAPLHFTLPGKACVYLKRRKGWDVSFSTNRPEEITEVLRSLGVQRGA